MDLLLENVLHVAKVKGKKDPDRKAKELFVLLFQNDEFRESYEKWINGKDELRGSIKSGRDFQSFWKKRFDYQLIKNRTGVYMWQYDFLLPAVYEFALIGTVSHWPAFGAQLTTVPMDGFEQPAIIIDPDASQEDISKFVRKNWKEIKRISGQDPFPKTGRIRPHKDHKLNVLVYGLKDRGFKDREILDELRRLVSPLKSENPLALVKKIIREQRRVRQKRYF